MLNFQLYCNSVRVYEGREKGIIQKEKKRKDYRKKLERSIYIIGECEHLSTTV